MDYSIYSFLATYPIEQVSKNFTYPAKANAYYIELDAIYNLSDQWSLAGSYTYERVNPFRSDCRNENRIWLQAQYYNKFDQFNLKNRLRYDFRFIQNRIDNEIDYSPRLRYLLGVDFPLNDKLLYFAAYNEFFLDTFKDRISSYSENWAFAGIGFNLSEKTTLEPGLLLISWLRNIEKYWLHQYFLQLTLVTKLDFIKE